MGLLAKKPAFEVSEKASFKPASSAAQTGCKNENSPVACLHLIFYTKLITMAVIRLPVCAGWSAPVLFPNPRRQVFE